METITIETKDYQSVESQLKDLILTGVQIISVIPVKYESVYISYTDTTYQELTSILVIYND